MAANVEIGKGDVPHELLWLDIDFKIFAVSPFTQSTPSTDSSGIAVPYGGPSLDPREVGGIIILSLGESG